MKKILIALLLACAVCFSLTACEDGSAKNVLENTDASAAETAAEPDEEPEEEEDLIEIPDAVKNISPEDDKALTGVLTADSYTNEYFGIRLNRFEDGTIESLMDEGTDLMPLSETYANEIGSIYIKSAAADNGKRCSVTISALSSNDQGKTEEEMVQDKYDFEQSVNESMESDAACAVESISIAGEEHPAYTEIMDDEGSSIKVATVYIIKGDFECMISITADVGEFDAVLKQFEKI